MHMASSSIPFRSPILEASPCHLSFSSFLFAHPPRRPLVFLDAPGVRLLSSRRLFLPVWSVPCAFAVVFRFTGVYLPGRQPWLLSGTFRRQPRNGDGRGRTVSRLPTSPRLQHRLHPSSCTTNDRQLLGKYSQGSRSGVKHPILPRIRWQSHSRTGLSVSPRMPFAYAATIEIFLFWRALITRAPLGLHPTVLHQRDRKARKTVASHARNSGDFRTAFNADSSHAYERVNERLTWQRLF